MSGLPTPAHKKLLFRPGSRLFFRVRPGRFGRSNDRMDRTKPATTDRPSGSRPSVVLVIDRPSIPGSADGRGRSETVGQSTIESDSRSVSRRPLRGSCHGFAKR
ncbi:hypothetical protein BRD01_05490 [Halobacteriales archaeon QS_8_65_32]|nr:MAG: hypothetical protein BRD01_05490 [Halobacteriales archaeon QS_8_65_32]